MTAYVTAEFTPRDKDQLQIYSAKAASTIAKFDGEFLAKGRVDVLVGATCYEYKALIVFPSRELAQGWFNSSEYQDLAVIRDKGMDATFLLIG